MANTYTQIYVQFVFAVKYREGMIDASFKAALYHYIIGVVHNNNHKLMAINGMPDHVHVFLCMKPTQSISDLMQDIKGSSSKWINEMKFLESRFEWQDGYGAFSYAKSQVDAVVNYIANQEAHHKTKTFRVEYLGFLKAFEVEYDERYIFKEPV